MSKKTRGPNFSSSEKQILEQLATKYKDVVEIKKTDAVSTAIKNDAWSVLTNEFNTLSTLNKRNTEQLKNCWDNIKRLSKNKDKVVEKDKNTVIEKILDAETKPKMLSPAIFQSQVEAILGPSIDEVDISRKPDPIALKPKEMPIEEETCIYVHIKTEVVEEEEPSAVAMDEDNCSSLTQENMSADESSRTHEIVKVKTEVLEKPQWSDWTPAAQKPRVPEARKKDNTWAQRRRPKLSIRDKILRTRLEMVEIMKKAAEAEAQFKNEILQEQLKQERIKTELAELQLKQLMAQQSGRYS